MKLLNLPLARVVLKRGKMADRAEEMVKNCTIMKSVCDIAVAMEKKRMLALEDISILEMAMASR